MDFLESKAVKYAEWCVEEDNSYVGKYVKLQCKEWLKIVYNEVDYAYIDIEMFDTIIDLLQLMRFPDNPKKTIYETLDDYGWVFVIAMLCTRDTDDNRLYETGLLEIARKQHKTYTSAIIFLIGMLIEPKYSRFFSVAPDYKLSNELRLAIKKIIGVSEDLRKYYKVCRDYVRCFLTEIEYIPLAYSNDGMDGKLAHIFLADEAGLLDQYPIEAMRSSQIELETKLGIIISTQYPNDDNAFIEEIDYAKRCLDGIENDKRYFSLLFEPNENIKKEWETNDLVIHQSNPNAIKNEKLFENIKKKRKMAILYENKRENYLCKHNNIHYKGLGAEGFIDVNLVKECKIEPEDFDWNGKDVYVGIDFSLTEDNTSFAMVTEYNNEVYAKVFCFIPSDSVEKKSDKEKVDYNKMINDGCCMDCGDTIIDYSVLEQAILDLEKDYGVNIVQIGYDVANARSSINKFENECLECIPIKQHSTILHAPTKLLKELIMRKQFKYIKNRLLEINFSNARCTEDTNLNKYVNKKKSAGKVDMVVSLINALYLLQQEQLNGNSWGVQR